MLKNNKRILLIILIILISIIVIISLNFILSKIIYSQKKQTDSDFFLKTIKLNPINNTIDVDEIVTSVYKDTNWRIQISKINLDAPILEGTEKEILRRGVGHFKSSSTWDGNVCLAAHNRGYKYNYFQEIKTLEIGDIIIYKAENGTRKYEVISNKIIQETNLSCIQNTKDNRITLITCEENKPEYRRCVQAKEKN